MLVGPLRDAVEKFPLIPFASTLFLFLAPGLLLSHWILDRRLSGAALVPMAFAISGGIFGLLAVPMLILHQDIEVYLELAGAVLAALLIAALVKVFLWRPSAEEAEPSNDNSSGWLLWGPFLSLSMALGLVSSVKVPDIYGDIWVYLAWVREFLDAKKLALHEPYFGHKIGALSRVKVDGWLLEQAALSKISGVDPVLMVLKYLAPVLVVVSLLAFYALARTLLKSEGAALFAGCLYALFFMANLDPSIFTFGGEFIGRIAEDKFVARFIFLPVALCAAVTYLESRKRRYLGLFVFFCWAIVTMHPIGLAILGLSMAGLCLIHLALNRRRKEAWTGMAGLGLAGISVIIIPTLYTLATGGSPSSALYSADINGSNPEVLANMVFVRQDWKHIYVLGDGMYMMHPSVILEPAILVSYLVGVPFLIWRVRRSLAAQLLLGMLLLTAFLIYVPPVATFLGNHVIVPGQLWRLSWPIPPAAILTLGWMVWELMGYARVGLEKSGLAPRTALVLPLVAVLALTAAVSPNFVSKTSEVYATNIAPQSKKSFPFDPIFMWMQHNLHRPGVVLAPDPENTAIPAYSSKLNVVSMRGKLLLNNLSSLEKHAGKKIPVPRGDLAVRKFFSGPSFKEAYRILRHYKVDYLMVYARSPMNKQLQHISAFSRLHTPSKRYELYKVDYRKLGQ